MQCCTKAWRRCPKSCRHMAGHGAAATAGQFHENESGVVMEQGIELHYAWAALGRTLAEMAGISYDGSPLREEIPMHETKKAVVLLSGGLDSATTLAFASHQGFELYAITFAYGQRHAVEIEAARVVARHFQVAQHAVVQIDLRLFGGSALTTDLAVPKGRAPDEMAHGIPVTYVPARNTIFLAFALAWSEVLGANAIFIGVNALDYSGYPDCRPEYIRAFQCLANLATKAAVEGRQRVTIHTPLIHLSKAEIIRKGIELGVDFGLTHTCYDPSPQKEACGACDACLLRLKGFAENGLHDPALYAAAAGTTSA